MSLFIDRLTAILQLFVPAFYAIAVEVVIWIICYVFYRREYRREEQ